MHKHILILTALVSGGALGAAGEMQVKSPGCSPPRPQRQQTILVFHCVLLMHLFSASLVFWRGFQRWLSWKYGKESGWEQVEVGGVNSSDVSWQRCGTILWKWKSQENWKLWMENFEMWQFLMMSCFQSYETFARFYYPFEAFFLQMIILIFLPCCK